MDLKLIPVVTLLLWQPLGAASKDDVIKRLDESAMVLSEIMSVPENGIPTDLLEKAHCVAIVPSLKKAAFIIGAKYGKGFISCREGAGWSAPASVRIEGGSIGFQIGGSETDLVMLVMNERGADRLLSSKFTIGGEGTVAAGPVGRSASAQTDAKFTAEILAYSRARGVFAGISLQGATLRQDLDDNQALYGRRLDNKDIVKTKVHFPTEAAKLQAELKKYSPHEK